MASVDLKIYGKVQGVFFRQTAKIEADKLGLVGWVRNDFDGTVEVLAVGPKENLDDFIKWCQNGSTAAKVDKVEVEWRDSEEDFESFEILY
ncbi:MAG: acylphosphatase [Candidatus Curtissbacteria bacterium]